MYVKYETVKWFYFWKCLLGIAVFLLSNLVKSEMMAAAFRLSKVFSFVSRRCVPLIRSQTLRLLLGTSTVVRLRSTLHVDIEQCDINTPVSKKK